MTESKDIPNVKLFSEDETSMQSFIKLFELSSSYAAEELKNKSKPKEATKQVYIGLVSLIDNLINKIKIKNDSMEFVKYGGIQRVLAPNLLAPYSPLREKMLKLIIELSRNNLIEVAGSNGIPNDIVHKLVRIFEKDRKMDHKTDVIKILNIWLPENPKMQYLVLKNDGLDVFYGQMEALDFHGIYALLSLSNKILKEHIKALNKDNIKEDEEDDKLEFYRKMQLKNKLSTKRSCNGMYNFFEVTWDRFNVEHNIVFSDYLGLMTYFKKNCLKIFTYRDKAKVLFEDMIRYISENEGNVKNSKILVNILADMLGYIRAVTKDEL